MESTMYTCAICGESYETVEERVECESKCLVERKKADEDKKREEYEKKRKSSENEIYAALSVVNEMIATHIKDYKKLSLNKNFPYLKYVFSNNSLWWL